MEDIRLAIGLMVFVSIAVFGITYRFLQHRKKVWLDVWAITVVGLLLLYTVKVWGQLWIVKYIPLPSVIILSNWFPPMLASLAAVAWLRFDTPVQDSSEDAAAASNEPRPNPTSRTAGFLLILRRLPVQFVLIAAAVYSVVYFIPGENLTCQNEWDPPIHPFNYFLCRQTTPYTCSAAAAATILAALGEETTEQEMAKLCLTKSGTTWLGLYHGMSWKLMGTGYRVEFFEADAQSIETSADDHPVLLCCRLEPSVARDHPEYVRAGWKPGTAHSLVHLGVIRGFHVIGDPAVGYELWTDEDLHTLWTGQGLRIRDRQNKSTAKSSAPMHRVRKLGIGFQPFYPPQV